MLTHKGYSLVEALCALLLFSLLAAATLPPLFASIARSEAQSTANLMLIRLQQVRTLSAQRGHIITICAGHNSCNGEHVWKDNLLFFEDRNGNGQREESERILRQEALAKHHAWQWASFRRKPYLQLQPDGSTYALNGTLTLCRDQNSSFQVVISLGGRPRIRETPITQAQCN